MGYRAQVITQHREYGSSIFCNFEQFQEYWNHLYTLYPDGDLFNAENSELFEIDKETVKKEIKRLHALGDDEEFEFQPNWGDGSQDTNGYIAESWNDALFSSPNDSEYVALEWY